MIIMIIIIIIIITTERQHNLITLQQILLTCIYIKHHAVEPQITFCRILNFCSIEPNLQCTLVWRRKKTIVFVYCWSTKP